VELLVVAGVIAVMIAILLPVLGRARAHARLVQCGWNLRSAGQALALYAVENRGRYPESLRQWHQRTQNRLTRMTHLAYYRSDKGGYDLRRVLGSSWSGDFLWQCPAPEAGERPYRWADEFGATQGVFYSNYLFWFGEPGGDAWTAIPAQAWPTDFRGPARVSDPATLPLAQDLLIADQPGGWRLGTFRANHATRGGVRGEELTDSGGFRHAFASTRIMPVNDVVNANVRGNVLYNDGHVDVRRLDQLQRLHWNGSPINGHIYLDVRR
jgi:hypothetical protein